MSAPTILPIPDQMKRLDRDPRGYPIPWIVYRDATGRSHFQINDDVRRYDCIRLDLCSICGHKLSRGRWFVGGPMSAFHEAGAFIDPPLHHPCMRYALQVCPYLAAPNYAKRIDGKTVSKDDPNLMLLDPTAIARRPEFFVAVMAVGQKLVGHPLAPNIVPTRPYRRVEYWRHGHRLTAEEGELLLKQDRERWPALIEDRRPPRMIKTGKAR
jgi:hypothetical protein